MLDNFQSLVYFLPETILTVTILAILAIDLLAGKPNLKRTAWLSILGLAASLAATVATMDGNARGHAAVDDILERRLRRAAVAPFEAAEDVAHDRDGLERQERDQQIRRRRHQEH